MRRATLGIIATLAIVSAGCSSSNSTTDPGGGGGGGGAGMSATINGTAWSAAGAPSASFSNGIFVIAGLNLTYGVSVAVAQISAGPGTYSLTYLNTLGSSGIVSNASKGWDTYLPGGSGSVTFTTLTTSHAVGTFSMVGAAASGGATGTITVTNGAFDVTY